MFKWRSVFNVDNYTVCTFPAHYNCHHVYVWDWFHIYIRTIIVVLLKVKYTDHPPTYHYWWAYSRPLAHAWSVIVSRSTFIAVSTSVDMRITISFVHFNFCLLSCSCTALYSPAKDNIITQMNTGIFYRGHPVKVALPLPPEMESQHTILVPLNFRKSQFVPP